MNGHNLAHKLSVKLRLKYISVRIYALDYVTISFFAYADGFINVIFDIAHKYYKLLMKKKKRIPIK